MPLAEFFSAMSYIIIERLIMRCWSMKNPTKECISPLMYGKSATVKGCSL